MASALAARRSALDDLVGDAHERAPHVVAVEDDLLVGHCSPSFLASRDRVKGTAATIAARPTEARSAALDRRGCTVEPGSSRSPGGRGLVDDLPVVGDEDPEDAAALDVGVEAGAVEAVERDVERLADDVGDLRSRRRTVPPFVATATCTVTVFSWTTFFAPPRTATRSTPARNAAAATRRDAEPAHGCAGSGCGSRRPGASGPSG